MYISNLNKEQVDKLMLDYFINPLLEVKQSSINGVGVFAKADLAVGTEFEAICLTGNELNKELHKYVWNPHRLIAGTGYFANGSCPYFTQHKDRDFSPYKSLDFNCVFVYQQNKFVVISEIKTGEEIILNYEDPYFFYMDPVTKKIDYNKLNTL